MSYSRYPAYKESGVPWLGDVPSHWEVLRLKNVVSLRNEKVSALDVDDAYIGLENIESGTARWIEGTSGTDVEGTANRYRANDVLFGKLRPYLAKVYRCPTDGIASTEFFVFSPQAVSTAFLAHLLLSSRFVELVDSSTYGAKMPRANWEFVSNIRWCVPPPDEQRAIAAFLDRETAQIDALIARLEALVGLLQEKRQALISHAVTKGLDPAAPMKQSGVAWLGEIPAHWEVLPLKRIAQIRYGLGQPPPESTDGVPLIRATNVDSGTITDVGMIYVSREDVPASRNAELKAGEIIVVRSGALTGDSAIVSPSYDGAIAGYDMVVSVCRGSPQFFAWTLLSSHVRDYQFMLQRMRAAQPHLNAEELGNTLVLYPPDREQVEIVGSIEASLASNDAAVMQCRNAVQLLQERRAALITAAVTGQIDVGSETFAL